MKNLLSNEATDDYVIQVLNQPGEVSAQEWNELLQSQAEPTPFMRHEFLLALHDSGCATPDTGWAPCFVLLRQRGALRGACVMYLKSDSMGDFSFDWGWARAYQQHGLDYYPKAVLCAPFVPVTGSRLLARSATERLRLLQAVRGLCQRWGVSGLHGQFATADDLAAFCASGFEPRHSVQFHWSNRQPAYADFDDFLSSLSQDKRKKIRQERRKVMDAGVRFEARQGAEIRSQDWDFMYRCYERTYLEHGSRPFLNRDFFARMASTQANDWVVFLGYQNGQPIASSLVAVNASCTSTSTRFSSENSTDPEGSVAAPLKTLPASRVAYGRHWGALQRVDCLHFEACYYQPLQWCIANGYQRFEGGAQGEHKLARALLPVTTTSAHWLAHPEFFTAVDHFLQRERAGVQDYVQTLQEHSPFKCVVPSDRSTG